MSKFQNRRSRFSLVVALFLCGAIGMVAFSPDESLAEGAASSPAIRQAERALRIISNRSARLRASADRVAPRRGGPDFSGRWAGRYVRVSNGCGIRATSLLFRHILSQQGGLAVLQTSHDGIFYGRSRDRGRRLEFEKAVSRNCRVGIIYKDLSRNGRVTVTGLGLGCSDGCLTAFGANAIRQ
jgi:hypothetical protein